MYDVAIVGAGVVGGMIARRLSMYNLHVCVIDKENDVAMGATKANSAIVHAGFDAKEGSLKALLNVKGSMMMEKIAQELDVKYCKNGSLVIGFNEEDKNHLEQLLQRGNRNGVPGLKMLEQAEIAQIEPNISKNVKYALYAPTGAIICPYELTIAAIGNAMDNGCDLFLRFEVSQIDYNNEAYTVYSKDGKQIKARFLINCAGVYADKLARLVGDDSFEIHARKGEYILLDRECANTVSHTIFRTPTKMGKGILITNTVDNNILIGPTSVDIEIKDNTETTKEGVDSVINQARENVSILQINKTITSFCGLRAVGSTGDFIINSTKPNYINVAGIESPGLSSSPAIAEYVEDMLRKMGLPLEEKSDYCPNRKSPHFFKALSMEEKNKVIREDSRFGHIICRCESITEGEIVYALNQNPKPQDLDAVKRRTRAQMGRCQGGFCSPYIVELLAETLQVPLNAITKSGGDSKILVGNTKEDI